jgi:phosphoserine phosphatase
MANLALFDLDHTLIPTDSDHEWGRFMVKHGMVDADSFARENDRFFADYKAGKLDIHAYLIAMLTPLAKYSRAQLAEFHRCRRPVLRGHRHQRIHHRPDRRRLRCRQADRLRS